MSDEGDGKKACQGSRKGLDQAMGASRKSPQKNSGANTGHREKVGKAMVSDVDEG